MTVRERVARALNWEFYNGCVRWEDTTDTATTGDAENRRRMLHLADVALAAAETGEDE